MAQRILLVSASLSLRGTSLYTVSLARELKLRGHKIAVLSPGGILEGALEEQDVPVVRAPVHGALWHDLLYLPTLMELARDFDPELIHVQSHPLAAIGGLIGKALDVPNIVTVHTPLQRPLRRIPGTTTRAIAVSEDVRQALVTNGRFPRERITVIPNGVAASLSSLDEETPPSDELPVVGTVGRFAPGRGIETFLTAARLVLDQGAKACFLVLGEGPSERELRRLARQLELTPHVTFALPRARIADLFRPMDIFASVGESEGHGIFILSAMAQARAVICTGVGGVLSFVRDGENGLLVGRADPDALAIRIGGLLAAPEERRRLGRAALHDVREQFPLHSMVEETLTAYEQALATPAPMSNSV
ncbi:MAG: glycosyltransferase family 1 protein [Planctomycetes bacterium]|nr:glycosyltransferase family 1 protein [Planctomycetota bacterium]